MRILMIALVTMGVFGGQCNDDDQKAINALDGGSAKGSFPEINSECGKQAYSIFSGFSNATFIKCFTKQIQASESCAACYAGAAEYGVDNCKSKCIFSWCSEGCLDCSKPNSANVNTCAGFTAPQPSACDTQDTVPKEAGEVTGSEIARLQVPGTLGDDLVCGICIGIAGPLLTTGGQACPGACKQAVDAVPFVGAILEPLCPNICSAAGNVTCNNHMAQDECARNVCTFAGVCKDSVPDVIV